LRTYYDRHKYSHAKTADFVAVAEEVAGRDLDALFDAWLFEEATPAKPGTDVDAAERDELAVSPSLECRSQRGGRT
jgi:aminopeptidase N